MTILPAVGKEVDQSVIMEKHWVLVWCGKLTYVCVFPFLQEVSWSWSRIVVTMFVVSVPNILVMKSMSPSTAFFYFVRLISPLISSEFVKMYWNLSSSSG